MTLFEVGGSPADTQDLTGSAEIAIWNMENIKDAIQDSMMRRSLLFFSLQNPTAHPCLDAN